MMLARFTLLLQGRVKLGPHGETRLVALLTMRRKGWLFEN